MPCNLLAQWALIYCECDKAQTVDMAETVESLSSCWKNNMTVQIFMKKRTICGTSTFPICVSEFPFPNSDHKPNRGSRLLFKNRT